MNLRENRVCIVAEAGVNHNGSIEKALRLVDAAASAGADLVKFQTFRAACVVSSFAPKADYQKKNTDENENQLDMVRKLELDLDAHRSLLKRCREKGIGFLSTPFDVESVDLLVDVLELDTLKISSGEITNGPLLLHVGQKGSRRIILSTGMSTLGEIEEALGALAFGFMGYANAPSRKEFRGVFSSREGQQILRENVSLLHCTTEYPAPFEEVNLRIMKTLRQAFGLPVGYSDHTEGIVVPIAAVAMGASVIEKHFTLDRNLPGPDHKASLEPAELAEMVHGIRKVEKALGSAIKIPESSEKKNLEIARKSLVAKRSIRKDELFTEENVTPKRPGGGISPMDYWEVEGRKAPRDFQADELLEI